MTLLGPIERLKMWHSPRAGLTGHSGATGAERRWFEMCDDDELPSEDGWFDPRYQYLFTRGDGE